MKTPTLEEVKEYFKDAEKVRCIYDNKEHEVKNIGFNGDVYDFYYTGVYFNGSTYNEDYAGLWSSSYGYAEITKYKSTNKVKNPNAKHYELWQDFEAIDIIKATLTEEEYLGYLKGNIIKYKLRDKGQDESDKVKIKDYTNELNNLINK